MSNHVWFWWILGAVLLAAELLWPGLVVLFLGVGAWVVALLVWSGVVSDVLTAGMAWFVISLALLLTLRRYAQRRLPSDHRHRDVDEDKEFEDSVVEVLADVSPRHSEGRVRLQGTSWAARALDEPIPKGAHARLLYREQLVWVVAPVAREEEET